MRTAVKSPLALAAPLILALALPLASSFQGGGAALTAAGDMQSFHTAHAAAQNTQKTQARSLHVVRTAVAPAVPSWPRTWVVRPGNSLAGIAATVYGASADWPWIWKQNKGLITNPPVIEVGWHLTLGKLTGPVPAAPQQQVTLVAKSTGSTGDSSSAGGTPPVPAAAGSTILSQAQIGQLWLSEGGAPVAEGTAECIAEHESGGNINAVSPTDDYGLFQEHDQPSMLGNPDASTRLAITMSDDGANWSPWTTAASCGV